MVVDSVLSETRVNSSSDVQIQFQELNILEDEVLGSRHAEEIPVLLINGKTHAYWRIDKDRFRNVLEKLL